MTIYELEKLAKEEDTLTEEAIVAMLASITYSKSKLERELRLFYQKYGKDGVVTYADARKWVSEKNHQRRLTWLLLLLSTSFSDLFSTLRSKFEPMISKIIEKEFEFYGVAPDTPKLAWGTDNLTWEDRLADDVNTWTANVTNDLKRSFLTKKVIDDVLEMLNKRFVTMENVVRSLGVTESTAASSIARETAFKELGIKKYRYYAREDERTCEKCGALHGLIFPMSVYEPGVTASPLHPRCRCWEVPIRE